MRIDIVSIFPGFFEGPLSESIVGKACAQGKVQIKLCDLRDHTTDRHRVTDDYPYGGGAGMVMKPEPIFAAVEALQAEDPPGTVVLLSPRGRRWSQKLAEDFSRFPRLILLCGRYEGEDDRVRQRLIDEEFSIGDYVLNGGEVAAMVLVESIIRLIPGVVGTPASVRQDSFSSGLLEHPHYTRPRVFRGMAVPEVLLSGNHAEISRWRRREALRATLKRRPDLLQGIELSAEDRELLAEVRGEDEEC